MKKSILEIAKTARTWKRYKSFVQENARVEERRCYEFE